MTAAEDLTLELGHPIVDVKKAEPGDARYWSVTTIIGVLDKPALIYWAAEETAKAALANGKVVAAIREESGDEEAIKWLTGARFRSPKDQRTAADLGTAVHEACEQYALTGKRPDVDEEVRPFLEQFDRWLQRFSPAFDATEVTVYHPDFGYAGTSDAFLTLDGVRLIVDYKTTRKSFDKGGKETGPYPEAGLQLAAYRYAKYAAVWKPRRFEQFRRRYYLMSEGEQALAVPVPTVDAGAVIHITPEHCHIHPVRCDERIHEAFLYALECARWQFELAKDVVGPPLVPKEKAS